MSLKQVEAFLLGVVVIISCSFVSAYPAVNNAHVHKRQSYGRSNQLVPSQDQYYAQPSYNNYNYNYDQDATRRSYYNNGYQQPQSQYYDYPPSQQQYYGRRDPLQGSYASVNPMQREITVRNGQLRQKEYQQRTGQEGRDTYDPFYFYVNPVAAAAGGNAPVQQQQQPQHEDPIPPPSSPSAPGPTTVTASLNAALMSREHVGGPPRNRRNSLNAPPRDPYFDNEISGDKYEILTSKPSYPRRQNNYPPPSSSYPSSRYTSTGSSISGYNHPPPGNPNQFLNYEQIVGAQPVS